MVGSRRALTVEVVFGALALGMVVPLWSLRYPPFQDFPQYVALAASLSEYGSPQHRFSHYFELNFATYTLLAPWLGAGFAKLSTPLIGAKLVVSLIIVGTPWALRELLRALERPPAYALFALPLAYNAHVVLGFVSYTLGIMLMLWGLAFGVRCIRDPRPRWQLALGITSVACMYSHVVPFAFLGLGLGIMVVVSGPPRSWRKLVVPLVPASLLAIRGFLDPRSGWQTLPIGLVDEIPDCPLYDSTSDAFASMPGWINDVFEREWDERLLLGMLGAGLLIVIAGSNYPVTVAGGALRRMRVGLSLLAPLALGMFFVLPRTCDWIFPIHARFLFVGVMLAVLLLPSIPDRCVQALALVLAVTALGVAHRTHYELSRFERELGDFEPALAAIPRGSAVAALIVDARSKRIKSAAFHHFGAYYQAERGGLTMFSFATMQHWPLRVRSELGIPELSFEFQFDPGVIDERELAWAEYVLTRGRTPAAVRRRFTMIYSGKHWRVFGRKPQRSPATL